jgi:hypothetical protein
VAGDGLGARFERLPNCGVDTKMLSSGQAAG